MRFSLSFSQAAELLQGVHAIAPHSIGTFRARLKHLQRLGFPSGINTGKGKAAEYGWREIILIEIAIQFIELGISPEHTRKICVDYEQTIINNIVEFLNSEEFVDHNQRFLVINISSIDHLKFEYERFDPIEILNKTDLISLFDFSNEILRQRISIINIMAVFGRIIAFSEDLGFFDTEKFGSVGKSLLEWARNYDQHPQA